MAPAQVGMVEPHLIEDEDGGCCMLDEDEQQLPLPPSSGLVKPVVLRRPVALKMARPIPQRATEQFYDEAYRQGIPAYAVNAAIMDSHDWHRKWTQQDEEGHTMPHDQPREYGVVPQTYAYQSPVLEEGDVGNMNNMVLDRMAGARNPSPEWGDEQERKRGRHMDEEEKEQGQRLVQPVPQRVPIQVLWDENSRNTSPSSLKLGSADNQEEKEEDYMIHVSKRPVPVRPPAPAMEDEEEEDNQLALNANPIVRPVALRVPRPVIAKLPNSSSDGIRLIPDFISADESSCSKMSVITQASGLSGKSSGSNNGYDYHQTNIREAQPIHVVEDFDERDSLCRKSFSLSESVMDRRDSLLQALAVSGGDAQAEDFVRTIDPLAHVFDQEQLDTRAVHGPKSVHGTWLTLTKPTFFGNLGENDAGDPMYTLGRMTFDMFSPTNLVCSLQGNFNIIQVVSDEDRKAMLAAGLVPKSLREEAENRDVVLRTYK